MNAAGGSSHCGQLLLLALLLAAPMAALARPQFFINFGSGKGNAFHHPFLQQQQQPAAIARSPAAATTPSNTAKSTTAAGAASSSASGAAPLPLLELTARYNTFPWTFTTQRIYLIYMVPPTVAPTAPPAYGNKQLEGFTHGQSYLALISYSDSAIGAYEELLYVPGAYQDPATCSSSPEASIGRIWVDSRFSQRAGRNIWGIPKELATFEWQSLGGSESLTVRDAATGALILQATLQEFPALPGFLLGQAFQLARNLLPIDTSGVQRPVVDPVSYPDQVDPATVPVYATARAAAAAGKLLTSDISFDLSAAQVTKITSLSASSEAFLGRPGPGLSPLLPLAIKVPAGSLSTITAPRIISC